MSQTEQILRAMALLEEFTVADLVEVCSAPPATVRTVLRRNDSLIETIGQSETGRPGGRWKRYRLRGEAREDALRVPLTPTEELDTASASGGVPASLLAAEELLLDAATAHAGEEERASLLRRAKRFRQEGEISGSEATDTAKGHRHAVDALISLVEGEGTEDRASLKRAREQALTARLLLQEHNPLNSALELRVADSPLQALPPEPARREIQEPPPKQGVGARSILADLAQKLVGTREIGFAASRPASAYGIARPTGRGMAIKARARARAPQVNVKTKVTKHGREIEIATQELPIVGPRKRATLRSSKLAALEAAESRHRESVARRS